MENNYYTPSIEEFHIGFEYKEYQFLTKDWKTVKCEFIKPDTTIDPKWFKVKYLDKEDIESLGWTDGETHGLSGYVLNYATDDSYQMYYDKDNQFTQIYNWNSKIIFEGIIKNKSELKRLLKQLGINGQ